MPEIPDVVAGQFVESSWGNDIRDRTVQRYNDATERDALNPLPVPGDLAYLDGTGEVQVYTAGAWFPIARSSYQSLLVYGDSQGYWLRPDPGDNTQDWRIVGGGGRVQLQTRASGSFVTVAAWTPTNYALTNETNDGMTTVPRNLVSVLTPDAGAFQVFCSGFLEASIGGGVYGWWEFAIRDGANTVWAITQVEGTGSVRQPIAMSTIVVNPSGNRLQLSLLRRSQNGGTQLAQRLRIGYVRIN